MERYFDKLSRKKSQPDDERQEGYDVICIIRNELSRNDRENRESDINVGKDRYEFRSPDRDAENEAQKKDNQEKRGILRHGSGKAELRKHYVQVHIVFVLFL